MPETFIQDAQPHYQLIGTIIAAVDYGIISCIFVHTLVSLITNKTHSYTRTMRKILIAYIVVMFALSTATVIQGFIYITGPKFTMWASTPSANIIERNEPLFLPFTIFGADGFMLWRIVLFNQNSALRYRIPLYGALFLISLASFGSAILYYLAPRIPVFASRSPIIPIIITISITTCLNFILTAMVVGRLLSHHEAMRRILGKQYRSPYWRLIVVLVESCSLIVVTGIIFLILAAQGDMDRFNSSIIPLLILPHVCVASPLLIVYQVAKGRALTCSTVALSQVETPHIADTNKDSSALQPIEFIRPGSPASVITELGQNTLRTLGELLDDEDEAHPENHVPECLTHSRL